MTIPDSPANVNTDFLPGMAPYRGLPPAVMTSSTSCAAGYMIAKGAARMRSRVFAWFLERGTLGGTDEECQLALKMKTQSQTPRRRELVLSGLLRDSGRCRPTTSGRAATVWCTVTGATP